MTRAENIITSLRDAGETMSDGLTIAMILNRLPDSFKPLAVHVTHNEDKITFTDFKRRIQINEESTRTHASSRKGDDATSQEDAPEKCGARATHTKSPYAGKRGLKM